MVPVYVSAWPDTRITYWSVSVLGFTYYVLRIDGPGPNTRIEANTRIGVANTRISKVAYLRKDLRNYVTGHR